MLLLIGFSKIQRGGGEKNEIKGFVGGSVFLSRGGSIQISVKE
jgi:hypothetical protein